MITQKPKQIPPIADAAASSFLTSSSNKMRRRGSGYLNLFDIVKSLLPLQCSW
jgi:hypothetical protein